MIVRFISSLLLIGGPANIARFIIPNFVWPSVDGHPDRTKANIAQKLGKLFPRGENSYANGAVFNKSAIIGIGAARNHGSPRPEGVGSCVVNGVSVSCESLPPGLRSKTPTRPGVALSEVSISDNDFSAADATTQANGNMPSVAFTNQTCIRDNEKPFKSFTNKRFYFSGHNDGNDIVKSSGGHWLQPMLAAILTHLQPKAIA